MTFWPSPADTNSVVVRAAWLYTRAGESVRMEVREEVNRYLLVVHGPGSRWHHEVCADYSEATQCQLAHEGQMLAQGYLLEGFEQWQSATRQVRTGGSRRGRITNLHSSEPRHHSR